MALLVVLAAAAAAAADAPPSPAASQPAGVCGPAADPWSAPVAAAPGVDARPLARPRAALWGQAAGGRESSAGGSWLRTTAALAGVVGLIVLLAWGYRAMHGEGRLLRGALRGRHAGLIEVVSRTALAPRHALCLVRVGPRLVLLGVSPDAVRRLDVIDDAALAARLLGAAAQQRPDSHTAEFARCLEREARGYPPEADGADETVTPEAGRVLDVKEELAGTLARLRAAAGRA